MSKYSNRELDHYFGEVHKTLDEILTQTQKTNGRVNKLEGWRTGITMTIVVLMTVVIPLIVYAYTRDMNRLEEKIILTK